MSNIKHTPEPWQITTIPFELRNTDASAAIYGPYSINEGACLIADISRSPGDNAATANASRIVACVNACAGMEDPAGSIEALRKELADIREFINAHPDESTYDEVVRKVTQLEKAFDKINK